MEEICHESQEQKPVAVVSNARSTKVSELPPSLLQPPPSTRPASVEKSSTNDALSSTGTIPAPFPPQIPRPGSPAMSNSHLSVNMGPAGTSSRTPSILSRNSSRPASVQQVAATASALMHNAEARQIRVALYGELVRGWYHLSTSSKILLTYYLGATIIEIVATVAVAVIERETARKCFYLLIFLALYLLRALVICVLLLRRFLYERPDDLPSNLSGACGAHYKTMINWASFVLVLLSISLLTTQSHCAQDSPGLYYLVLVFSLIGYLCLALLLILWFLVLFCLNGLVVLLELFGVGPRVMQWRGATPEMINDIPLVKYTKHEQLHPLPESTQGHQLQLLSSSQTEKRVAGTTITPSIVISADTTGSHSGEYEQEPPRCVVIDMESGTGTGAGATDSVNPLETPAPLPTTAEQDEDDESKENPSNLLALEHLSPEERELAIRISTSCPICLCDYEDLEELRQLPCDHYFHMECVDEWLKLKRTCPLCKCDIIQSSRRGSKLWSRRSSHGHGRRRSSASASGSGGRRFSLGSRQR